MCVRSSLKGKFFVEIGYVQPDGWILGPGVVQMFLKTDVLCEWDRRDPSETFAGLMLASGLLSHKCVCSSRHGDELRQYPWPQWRSPAGVILGSRHFRQPGSGRHVCNASLACRFFQKTERTDPTSMGSPKAVPVPWFSVHQTSPEFAATKPAPGVDI